MNCNEVRRDLESLLDDAPALRGERRLQPHLSSCAACRGEYARLRAVRALLRRAPAAVPSPALDSRVMRSFDDRRGSKSAVRSRRRGLLFGSLRLTKPVFALLLIGMAATAALAFWAGQQSVTPILVAAPRSEPEVPIPVRRIIEVPVERIKIVRVREVVTQGRAPSDITPQRNTSSPAGEVITRQPIKSFTVISSTGTNYSTVAALSGFDPLPRARARVIKGGEQR